MLVDHQSTPEILRATGTSHSAAEAPHSAQRQAQQTARETPRSAAKGCARESEGRTQKKTPKSLHIADLSDDVRDKATHRVSRGGGTRTPDTRIMIQRVTPDNPGKNTHSENCAASGAAVGPVNAPADPDLQVIIEAWPNLESKVREAVVTLVKTIFKGPKNDSSGKSSPY